MAALLAGAPSLGTLMLTTFVLGDAAALYALSNKKDESTGIDYATKAKVVQAIQRELDAFEAVAKKGVDPKKIKQAIIAAIRNEVTAFKAVPKVKVKQGVAASEPRVKDVKQAIIVAIQKEVAAFKVPDKPSGEPIPSQGKADVVATLTYDQAVEQFVDAVTKAKGKAKTAELVKTISKYPQIVTKTWTQDDGTELSTLQLIVQAAIADAVGKPLSDGFMGALSRATSRGLKALGSFKPVGISNPLLRRRHEAELREAAYKGGATQAEWASVVTQILRTPYVYDDSVLEANRKPEREAASKQEKDRRPDDLLKRNAESTRNSWILAETLAIQKRKANLRPNIGFNDLIAMRGITDPALRKRAATNLVPVLNAFMWWRWNVLHFPLSYTAEQVVDAEHLLDGMTADTQPIAAFWNASVTLRRHINEMRGATLSPQEEREKAAYEAAMETLKRSTSTPEQKAEREAAEAAVARSNRPGAQEAHLKKSNAETERKFADAEAAGVGDIVDDSAEKAYAARVAADPVPSVSAETSNPGSLSPTPVAEESAADKAAKAEKAQATAARLREKAIAARKVARAATRARKNAEKPALFGGKSRKSTFRRHRKH